MTTAWFNNTLQNWIGGSISSITKQHFTIKASSLRLRSHKWISTLNIGTDLQMQIIVSDGPIGKHVQCLTWVLFENVSAQCLLRQLAKDSLIRPCTILPEIQVQAVELKKDLAHCWTAQAPPTQFGNSISVNFRWSDIENNCTPSMSGPSYYNETVIQSTSLNRHGICLSRSWLLLLLTLSLPLPHLLCITLFSDHPESKWNLSYSLYSGVI